MKRIWKAWITLLFAVLIICAASFACVAEEIAVNETDTETQENHLQAADEADSVQENHTLLGRLEEYIVENRTDVLGVAGDAAILVISLIFGFLQKSKNKKITASLAKAVTASTGVATSQNDVVGAVNTLIESYNELKTSYGNL